MQAKLLPHIPPAVARKLGYYVYVYVNPLTQSIFYVGKGKGGRALAHIDDVEKRKVAKVIRSIRAEGAEPVIEILAHGLSSEDAAYRVEAAVIDALGISGLANAVHGWRSRDYGRAPLEQLIAKYTTRKADIREPAILIRINELYSPEMSAVQLYDVTRAAWVVGARRQQARYAFAVFEGVVREVYKISTWLRAGSTFHHLWAGHGYRRSKRWEFVGVLAEETLRRKYVNRYVGHLFSQGAQNPISYVNIE